MVSWIKRYKYTILALVLLLLLPIVIVFAQGFFTLQRFGSELPMEAAVVFDRNGELIGSLGNKGRFITIEKIPPELIQAIIAIEDSRFNHHGGIDIIGITRALFTNLRASKVKQGGSTITQQTVKNIFLHPQRTLARKLQEFALAILFEKRYSKDEILEFYLNTSYFGEGAYGIDNAAQTYFNKDVSHLTLGESALLAGLLQAPSKFSPYTAPEKALERRNLVIDRMIALELINSSVAKHGKEEKIVLAPLTGGTARYFLSWISDILIEEFGEYPVFNDGLRVHTTLDLEMQRIAEKIFLEQPNQGSLVALHPYTGGVLALVGGRNYLESQFNRALFAKRQPGSVFKPVIYAAAIKDGWQVNSIVEDAPKEYSGYKPNNVEDAYWGPVTMKHALAFSLNNAAVWTLNEIGISKAFSLANQLEIDLLNQDRNLALALGGITHGVSPLQMTAAILPFSNGGAYFSPNPIVKVLNLDGDNLLDQVPQRTQILSPQQAYLVSDMLQAVMEYGTGKDLPVQRPAAGKSGTTNDQKDLWFIGFTPDIVVGVYIGNDDNSPMEEGTGSSVAGPIWAEFIDQALANEPARDFPVPSKIIKDVTIDVFTGLLANEQCAWTELDAFIEGTVPSKWAPCALPKSPPPTAEEPSSPSPEESTPKQEVEEPIPELEEPVPGPEEPIPESEEPIPEPEEPIPEPEEPIPEPEEPIPEPEEPIPEPEEPIPEPEEPIPEIEKPAPE